MNIPERELSDQARARRRAELMEAIEADGTGPAGRSRRAWVTPLAAAAAVAVVGGTAYLATTVGGDADSTEHDVPAAGGGDGSAAPESNAPSREPKADCRERRQVSPRMMRQQMADYRALLPHVQAYRDVVAAHLDPRGRHLDRRATNVQSSGSGCALDGLGTKVGWTTAGEDGMGVVRIEVASGKVRDTQVWMSYDGWESTPSNVPGVASLSTIDYGDGFAVAVVRSDGVNVLVDANLLFGNNSLVGIDGFPFTTDDLVEVAMDPELQLP